MAHAPLKSASAGGGESGAAHRPPPGTAEETDIPSPYGAPGGYGAPETPSPYGAPGGYGAPQTPSPYGAPAGGGYGTPAGGYGAPGAPGAYGGYPPPKKSNTGLIVGLAIGGVVFVIIIVAVLANVLGGSGSYGSDPELDRLYDQCAAGDNLACDDLHNRAPEDSDYKEFGDTCGGRTNGGTWCVNEDF